MVNLTLVEYLLLFYDQKSYKKMSNPYQPPEDEFLNDETQYHGAHEGPDYEEAREYWPTCPECGKRLTVTCPFCKTTDDLFPLGDTDYWDDDLGGSLVEYQKRIDRNIASRSILYGEGDTSMPLDERSCSCNKPSQTPSELYGGARPELSGGHCGHGQGCCGKHDHHDEHDDGYRDSYGDEDDDMPERDYDRESLPFVVICPTCHEAFIPSFPGGCRRCHYVWDKSKSLDPEEAVVAHKKMPNPALREVGGLSLWQLALGVLVLLILIVVLVQMLPN